MSRSVNLCKEARGRECQIRIPHICNFDAETTVLAHYRLSGISGVGLKPPDSQAAFACSSCHDAMDGRLKTPWTREQLRLMHAEGVFRTQYILKAEGKL